MFDKNLKGGDRPEPEPGRRGVDWVALCRESKPLIAAINGASIGVGLTLVLPFDQILAAKGAKLSCRFVKMGLVPELASSHFLTIRCGFGAASWLALSGATVLAEEAKELGLVDRVCEPDALVDEAMAMADELAGNPPTQLRLIKQLLTPERRRDRPRRRPAARDRGARTSPTKSPEHEEAVAAFLERRTPVFR